MVNNVNPATSKLLDQIKRLSAHTTKKEENHVDFKDTIINNKTNTTRELKTTNLLNSIEKMQKKINIPTEPVEDIKMEIYPKSLQTSELPSFVDISRNDREEPLGTFLDVYL
ncbi:MAG: hypothetical protein AYP45_14970 [Candidatus Brocadia carolinensis]|uniref:Uncharacterized protein n=1 Tax=Candidatus Brocadia carolinensis TaxID=1004156 RepID=A0A1V4AQG3_9BACT|nr:MAG: hypothetical protein AYP45_14970 [Candidatus Brocadia caroliniensis]